MPFAERSVAKCKGAGARAIDETRYDRGLHSPRRMLCALTVACHSHRAACSGRHRRALVDAPGAGLSPRDPHFSSEVVPASGSAGGDMV